MGNCNREGTEEETKELNKERKAEENGAIMEEKMDILTEMMKNFMATVKSDLEEIKNEVNKIKREVSQVQQKADQTIDKVERMEATWKEKEKAWKAEKELLERRMEEMEKSNETQERFGKRNNIIIKGLQITGESNMKQNIKTFLKNKLDVEVMPMDAFEMGKDRNNKTMVVKLNNWEDKMKVMKNKSKLRGGKVYIDSDLTKKELHIQKTIRELAKKEIESGNRVRVGYQKITINNKTYEWRAIEQNLEGQSEIEKQDRSKN